MARKGTMFEREINSKFLNEKMIIKIYLPERFDSLYENNICIMQDGDDYFQLGRVATLSDKLHNADEIVNTTFVGIHYLDRLDRLKKYHPEGEQFDDYIQFLTEEVVPLVDELLPINPLGTIRTLMGDSLAGTIALMTAIKHANIFHKVLMQSPLIDATVLDTVQFTEGINSIEVYHSIGLKETEVPTTADGLVDFLTPNRHLSSVLKIKLFTYHYNEIPNGNHTWKYWQQELPDALVKILS